MTGLDLVADCENCSGLCCVALPFTASADFAIDKPAAHPCPNLEPDFRCGIHARLRDEGFRGCTVFDCFGAGQKVSQVTFGGRNWRSSPQIAGQMFEAFATMRQLHELLWYVNEALTYQPALPVHPELRVALEETDRLTQLGPEALIGLDVAAHRAGVNHLLVRASELARAGVADPVPDYRGADLIGRDLREVCLVGANLRGAHLIAADLRAVDLTSADLTGADLRDADLRGTDLTGSLFVTQSQLSAARGDAATGTPTSLTRPAHWSL